MTKATRSPNLEIILNPDVKGLANLKLPDPDLLSYYNKISDREIYWNRDVDDDLVEYSHQIIQWNIQDKDVDIENRKPIKVYINSDGGSLNAVLNFINLIKLSETPVHTITMGRAYSAGFLMLIAGHERYCFEYSEGLLHSGSFGVGGSTEKVMDYIEHTKKMEIKVKDYVISNTSIPLEMYEKNYRNEWYMTSEEMLEFGVVDKIIMDINEVI